MRSIGGTSRRSGTLRAALHGAALGLVLAIGAAAPARAQDPAGLVVRGLKFEGNKALDDFTLSAAISTTNSSTLARSPLLKWMGLGEKRYFDERAFQGDYLRLLVIYRASGYLDVKVDTTVRRTDTDVYITFKITEGPPVRLVSLDIKGLDEIRARQHVRVVRDLPLAVGDVFSRYVLAATRDTVLTRLRDNGFPHATVTARFGVETGDRIARATLEANPGVEATFGDIHVRGQQGVDSGFIASIVTAHTGDPFKQEELYRSQRALYSSELFRFANIAIDSTVYGDSTTKIPLVVDVQEGRMHRAQGSIGYGTNDCFRTGLGWTARNFLGGGRIFDVSGRLSKIGVGEPLGFGAEKSLCSALKEDSVGSRKANYGLSASLRRNGFLSPDNALVLSLFAERRSEFKVYLREEVGASASLTRETSARVPVTLSYRLAYGVTTANPVSFCSFFNACASRDIAELQQRRPLATLSLSAVKQRVNNLLDPTRGTLLSAEATVSSRFIGSSRQQQFFRIVGDASGFVPLTRSIVLAGHLRGGAVFAPKLDLSSGAANFVPPEQRFYAGGPNDVRGFDRNQLGPLVYVVPEDSIPGDGGAISPTAVRAAATGGDRVAIGNLELRLPSPILSSRMRFAAFVDAGALWDGGGRAKLRVTPGFGIRLASPLGPIRFDAGYNRYPLEAGALYKATKGGDLVLIQQRYPDDPQPRRKFTLHFSVGQAF